MASFTSFTFLGVDAPQKTINYRGITGRTYSFSVAVPSALHVAHGTTLTRQTRDSYDKEKKAETTNLFTVAGVAKSENTVASSDVGAVQLPCDLYLHEHGSANPTVLKNVISAEDLFRRGFTVVEQPPSSTPFVGPLGVAYNFQTSRKYLSSVFGVQHDEKYFIKSLSSNVRIVGELFGVLWVAKDDAPDVAVPLAGATNEDALHGLHGLCEPIATLKLQGGDQTPISPTADQLVSTPRRATLTPRRATGGSAFGGSSTAAGGGVSRGGDTTSSSSGVTVNQQSGMASCQGPMGVRLKLDTRPSALKAFGVVHNQKLVGRIGLDAGRLCRVVGVTNGALYVLFDGDARVTCVRNCDDAESVKKQFSDGTASLTGASTTTNVSRRAQAPATALPIASLKPSTSTAFADVLSPASPRIASKIKQFWTTFGRLEFDTSDSACAGFGFHHGQVLRGSVGSAKGKMYTVVGSRLGNLWVIEEGKYRATALVHCTNKEELTKMYGLVPTGAVKDLRAFYEASLEPPVTPMHTPRFRLSSQSPPRNKSDVNIGASALSFVSPSPIAAAYRGGSHVELSPPSPRGSASPQHENQQQQQQQQQQRRGHSEPAEPLSPPISAARSNLNGILPQLNLSNVSRDDAPLPTVVGSSNQHIGDLSPRGDLSEPQNQQKMQQMQQNQQPATQQQQQQQPKYTIEQKASVIASPAAIALAQPSAREYLKAWALLKMGHRAADFAGPSPTHHTFHHYYMEDTIRRVGEAFAKLPRARQVWKNENRAPDFYSASTQEILRFLHERPSVSAY